MLQVTGAKTSPDSLPERFLLSGPSSHPPGQQQAFGKYSIKKGSWRTSCKSRERNRSTQPPGCTQAHERARGQWPEFWQRSSSVAAGNCREQIQPHFLAVETETQRGKGRKKNARVTECLLCTGQNTRPCPSAVRAAAAPPGGSGHLQGIGDKQTLPFSSNSKP